MPPNVEIYNIGIASTAPLMIHKKITRFQHGTFYGLVLSAECVNCGDDFKLNKNKKMCADQLFTCPPCTKLMDIAV